MSTALSVFAYVGGRDLMLGFMGALYQVSAHVPLHFICVHFLVV